MVKSWKGALLRVSKTIRQPLQMADQDNKPKPNNKQEAEWVCLSPMGHTAKMVGFILLCECGNTSHKINHSKTYSSVTLCTFKMLCDHNLHLPPKQFIISIENPTPVKLSEPLENFSLLSVSMELPILGILWKCNHTYLASFLA